MNQVPEVLNRKIIISQPIDEQIAGQIIDQIIAINEFDAHMETALREYQPEPIEMFINSGGGSATDGFAIIGAMEMSDTPIITYGLGIVASMALGIFVKGDIRIAHRYTRFMYHSVAYGVAGFIKDHEEARDESDMLQRMYNNLFNGTKLTREKMADIREKKANFFFSGKEAVELGIADEMMKKPEKKIELMTQEQFDALQAKMEKEDKE